MNNLAGIKLTVESITRQSVIDASYIGCCDNCGRVIVNIATVKDEQGKAYDIGLDCKKTLIDKPILDSIKIEYSESFDLKYKLKEYKSNQNEVAKFLKFAAYNDVEIDINNSDVIISDKLPSTQFEGHFGNIIYMQNTQFLVKMGLGKFLQDLQKKNN